MVLSQPSTMRNKEKFTDKNHFGLVLCLHDESMRMHIQNVCWISYRVSFMVRFIFRVLLLVDYFIDCITVRCCHRLLLAHQSNGSSLVAPDVVHTVLSKTWIMTRKYKRMAYFSIWSLVRFTIRSAVSINVSDFRWALHPKDTPIKNDCDFRLIGLFKKKERTEINYRNTILGNYSI